MIDYKTIRPDIREALDRYASNGIPTGDFLRAVLSDDLMEAVCRADDDNILTIHSICGYICNELPAGCHGSPEAYKAWIEKHKATREAKEAPA